MISRVQIAEDGTVLALHQDLLLAFGDDDGTQFPDALAAARESSGSGTPEPRSPTIGMPAGRASTVYRSRDARTWERTTIDPAEIGWSRQTEARRGATTFSFGPAGTVVDQDGKVHFSPIEEPEDCLDSFSPNPFRLYQDCQLVSSPGPHDMAVGDDRVVVALGTEGVAVLEDGRWRQRGVDTLRPRSFARRHRNLLVAGAVVGLVAAIATLAYATRYRDDQNENRPPR